MAIRRECGEGITLTAVHTKSDTERARFKSSIFSLTFVTPLRRETAAVNALIPSILRRGTQDHPDLQSLAAALDELYGGSIEPLVRKRGESQCIGFVASFLDDAYIPDGSRILSDAIRLLCEILLRPCLENGLFRADYTEQEKANLKDRIEAEVNEKRQYAVDRLLEEMCREEPYGVGRAGKAEDVDRITPRSAWEQYRALLAQARIELYYSGSLEPDTVFHLFPAALSQMGLSRASFDNGGYPVTSVIAQVDAVRTVEERMDVNQGKLVMGFRTGGITVTSPNYPALVVCNAVFGGTTTSKLFLNVREKLSLCYYVNSSLIKQKGILLVSSGVEFQDKARAEEEILAQLEACREGEIEDRELEGAKEYLISSLRSVMDSQGRQEDWWLGQALSGQEQTPQELIDAVRAVTREDVVAAAKAVTLDTVYFLRGMEE